MAATAVCLGHHVEEKGLNVKVECLVLQEQLGHEAEVLAVDFVFFSVHFEDRELVLAVDFVSRRVLPCADTLHNMTIIIFTAT